MEKTALEIPCPQCYAESGLPCRRTRNEEPHAARLGARAEYLYIGHRDGMTKFGRSGPLRRGPFDYRPRSQRLSPYLICEVENSRLSEDRLKVFFGARRIEMGEWLDETVAWEEMAEAMTIAGIASDTLALALVECIQRESPLLLSNISILRSRINEMRHEKEARQLIRLHHSLGIVPSAELDILERELTERIQPDRWWPMKMSLAMRLQDATLSALERIEAEQLTPATLLVPSHRTPRSRCDEETGGLPRAGGAAL